MYSNILLLAESDPYATVTHQDTNAATGTSTTSSDFSSGTSSTSSSTPRPSYTCPPPPICTADAALPSCLASQLAAEQARPADQYRNQQEQHRLSTWQAQNHLVMQQNNEQAEEIRQQYNEQAADIRRQNRELAHRFQAILRNDPVCLSVSNLPADDADFFRSFRRV